MVEGQSMTTVADVVAQVRDGRLEDFVREAVVLVARLKSENVKFLEEIHPWGNSRAAMIEGPDRIAIEIVEVK